MSSPSPVALIFGAAIEGSNVGGALTKGFLGAGYRVASVSRHAAEPSQPEHVHIAANLAEPSSIADVFDAVSKAGWAFPAVIIWNVSSVSPPAESDPTNPFAVADADFDRDQALMVKSPYLAARKAVEVWLQDEDAGKKRKGTFIMTGNACPRFMIPQSEFPVPLAMITTLGIGKSGAAYFLATADEVYKEKGLRFFFADERKASGQTVGFDVSGESHVPVYLEMVTGGDDWPYYVTFAEGKYVKFDL
ncbi:hypothetical protein N0V93_002258 [Gnomoniopsis smithogilvyi]|uniref:Uncharacterized protein n=1 Tax=Gnomoniopsis smithogilvyi TaxID=1191159 RepID=A0A9W8YYA9_9PEZI|nr:hypothetical protein N0V93_002258 [Gnomoniopsis smithogilvyi]